MTTGTFNFNDQVPASSGGWWGTKITRSWSGTDRARTPKPPHNTYTTYREYTDFAGIVRRKDFTFRIPHPASSEARVVKRAYEEEHPYSLDHQRLFSDRVSYTVSSNYPQHSDMTIHGATSWAPETLISANDVLKLIGRLQDLVQGSDFNLGIALGELGDTVGLIGDTAGRMAGALGAARNGQFGKAADYLFSGTKRRRKPGHKDLPGGKPTSKMLADNWLELQYGWLPLLKDVEAGAQMLAHHLNVPLRKSYRVSMRKELMTTRNTQVGYNSLHRAIGKGLKVHRKSIIARIEEAGSIPQLLGLTNPELVAWELVPYSFVADWFIPIGDWLQARAFVSHLKGTFITSDKRTGYAFSPTSQYFAFQPRGNNFRVLFQRTVSTTLDVPMPRMKPLGKVASWQHCVNAVGLLVSGFAGRKD